MVSVPVRVPPVIGKFPLAIPFNAAVIVPAEKLPDASRITPVLAMFELLNVMLPACHILLPLTCALFDLKLIVPVPTLLDPPVNSILESKSTLLPDVLASMYAVTETSVSPNCK